MWTMSSVATEGRYNGLIRGCKWSFSRFFPHQMVYLYTDTETRSLIEFLDRKEPSGIDSHHPDRVLCTLMAEKWGGGTLF